MPNPGGILPFMITFPERDDLLLAVDALRPMMLSRLLGNIPSLRLGLWDAATYGNKDDYWPENAGKPVPEEVEDRILKQTDLGHWIFYVRLLFACSGLGADESGRERCMDLIRSRRRRGRSSRASSRTSRTFASSYALTSQLTRVSSFPSYCDPKKGKEAEASLSQTSTIEQQSSQEYRRSVSWIGSSGTPCFFSSKATNAADFGQGSERWPPVLLAHLASFGHRRRQAGQDVQGSLRRVRFRLPRNFLHRVSPFQDRCDFASDGFWVEGRGRCTISCVCVKRVCGASLIPSRRRLRFFSTGASPRNAFVLKS